MPKYLIISLLLLSFVFSPKVSAINLINNTTNIRGYFDGVQNNANGTSIYGWACNQSQPNVSQTVRVYLTNVSGTNCVSYRDKNYCYVSSLNTQANTQRSGTSPICGFDRVGYSIIIPNTFEDSTIHYALVSVLVGNSEYFLEITPGADEWFFLTEPEPEQFDYNNDGKTDLKDLIILLQALFN